MALILSMTFEVITDESAAQGDAAEHGFTWQDVPHGFRETVELIRSGGFIHPSDSHGVPRWITSEAEQDPHEGDWTSCGLHPAQDERTQRYWAKACRAAGINSGTF